VAGYIFQNFRVVTPLRVLDEHSVVVENGRISRVEKKDILKVESDFSVVDAHTLSTSNPCYLVPGLIDLHVHGGGGCDCLDCTEDALHDIACAHACGGTTAFFPTIASAPFDRMLEALAVIARLRGKKSRGALILGAHIEGPFFSPEHKGAQNERFLRTPSIEDVEKILRFSGTVKKVTMAPELPGALECGKMFRDQGIQLAIGHSDATYEDVLQAIENGFTSVTHIYSGMSGVKRVDLQRVAGVIESALLLEELEVEFIGDGIHLPSHLVQFILKNKGVGRVCAVTDAMRAAGLNEGVYEFGGMEVLVEGGVAKLMDKSAFAGSVATMDRIVRNLLFEVGLRVEDAIKLASYNPARSAGVDDRKGSISVGKDADLVLFDATFRVLMTMVKGSVMYSKYVVEEGNN